jgi:sigma-B regulation protein RsbU (phosphoserine phosphatase)
MGHGVRAALVTALQRAFVEEFTGAAKNPGEFMSQINRALLSILQRTGTPLFVSGFYMFVDAEKSELHYSVAGHPKQLLIRRNAGTVETLPGNGTKPGPALGVFNEQRYETLEARLTPGDLVMLFTDGLFEVEDADGALFDEGKLAELVRGHIKLPPEAMSGAILADIKKFSADGKFADDVCLLLMDFEGIMSADSTL